MGRPKGLRPPSVKAFRGADGDWHAYPVVGVNEDGTTRRLHRQAKSRELVDQKVREVDELLARGEPIPSGRSKQLGVLLLYWINVACVDLARGTRDKYRGDVTTYIIPRRGTLPVDRLTRTSVERLFAELAEDGATDWTRNSVYRTLRAGLNYLIRSRHMTGPNPMKGVPPPTVTEKEIQPLSVADGRAVIAEAARLPRHGARWTVALCLGTRQGESLGFEWKRKGHRAGDVDLEAGTIRVRDQLQRHTYSHGCDDPHDCVGPRGCGKNHRPDSQRGCGKAGCRPGRHRFGECRISKRDGVCIQHRLYTNGKPHSPPRGCPPPCPADCTGHARHCPERVGGLVKVAPKSASAKRIIALPEPLRLQLIAHKAQQDREREAAGDKWQENNLVFCTPLGRPLDPSRDNAAWSQLLAAAGVEPARLHDARHTAATLLLIQGVDSRTVMAIMGWSQQSMLKRYQHVVDELRREAADRMSVALWG